MPLSKAGKTSSLGRLAQYNLPAPIFSTGLVLHQLKLILNEPVLVTEIFAYGVSSQYLDLGKI